MSDLSLHDLNELRSKILRFCKNSNLSTLEAWMTLCKCADLITLDKDSIYRMYEKIKKDDL